MNTRIRVKYCGLTNVDNAIFAANLAVDAIGLVFYSKSPRNVELDQAANIISVLPPFVSVVGLFVNPTSEYVEQVISQVSLNVLQFHGDEPEKYCNSFSLPYMKAVRMAPNVDVLTEIERYNSASGILLDSFHDKYAGGTGETFDWSRVPNSSTMPIILAGGLNTSNVADAILKTQPYAVDVSSGIEVSKGIKDNKKMQQFMNEVNLLGSK
ncbi:Phosphoribosylanthranilate isomerase [hydrothermal vent metagenome]|uniref:phosphoribosylanthranilate isomerase n=1 Tax=hydrothermal vent metagenome TaxID=652676 RepID=A0A3B1AK59_9ZZZZ